MFKNRVNLTQGDEKKVQYCDGLGVKHELVSGVIFLDDRSNYSWNCAIPNVEEKNVKIFKFESKLNKPLLVYE